MRLALAAPTEELDPLMRDRETGARLHPFGQRARMRFGYRGLDVRYAPAAETREVMVRPGVRVEAVSWPRELTEQPSVAVTARDTLFSGRTGDESPELNYTVLPGGRGFIIANDGPTVANPYGVVVLSNWQSLFPKAARATVRR